MAQRRDRRSSRRLLVLVATLLATIAVALTLAIVFGPIVQRERHIAMLRSETPDERLRGMTYLINHAEEPALHRRLARLLSDPKTGAGTHAAVAQAMRHAGTWGPSIGPAWLHYLRHRAAVGGAYVREAVAIELTRAGLSGAGMMGEPLAGEMVSGLAADASAAVRRMALRAAATLPPEAGAPIIAGAFDDAEPSVAYWAYLHAGWNGAIEIELPGAGRLAEMPPEVAMAAMWAAARHGAADAGRLMRVAEAGEGVGAIEALVPYVMGVVARRGGEHAAGATDRLMTMIEADKDAGRATNFALLKRWRAVLALPLGEGEARSEGIAALGAVYRTDPDGGDGQDEAADLLAAAAGSRLARHLDEAAARAALGAIGWSGAEGRFWRELAVLESAPTGSVAIDVRPTMPPLARAAAVRVAAEPGELEWLNALDTEAAGVRHMAAFAAIDRLDAATLDGLIAQLLQSRSRDEQLSGALLAGLAGRQAELVRRRVKLTDDWLVSLHLKLALYMMGEEVVLKPVTLLVRQSFPRETVLLALMHRGERAGMDRFFEPVSEVGAGRLRRMLDQQRYWHALKRYVPADAPTFWLWGDRAVQLFQVDVMRAWYLSRARQPVSASGRGRPARMP